MSLFLSHPRFDFRQTSGNVRLIGQVIDPAAESAHMTVVAHDQIFSDPAQGDTSLPFDQVTD